MKPGVEAGDLGKIGQALAKGFDGADRLRQVLGIDRDERGQISDEGRADLFRFPMVGAAMDDAMADASQTGVEVMIVNLDNEPLEGRTMIGKYCWDGLHRLIANGNRRLARIVADSFNREHGNAIEIIRAVVQRRFQTR